MTHEFTIPEMYESLNGYEELAITKTFGDSFAALSQKDQTLAARALVFVAEKRKDLKDAEAKKAAFEMKNKDLLSYFTPEADEIDPDDPDSESGKGD